MDRSDAEGKQTMITPIDIKIAINTLLEKHFPKAPVISQDIEKGFQRPSMSVYFEDVKIESLGSQIETGFDVFIYYFPELHNNDASVDLLDMQFQLPAAIGSHIVVADRALHVNEPVSDVVDGVLVHQFTMLFEQFNEINDPEKDAQSGKDLTINF